MPRLSTLFWLLVIGALLVGWHKDSRRQTRRIDRLQQRIAEQPVYDWFPVAPVPPQPSSPSN